MVVGGFVYTTQSVSAAVVVTNQLTGSNLTAVTDMFDVAGSVGASGTYSLVITTWEWLLVNVAIVALMIAVFFVWNWFRRRLSTIF